MRNKREDGAVVIAHKVDSSGTKRLGRGHDSGDGDFRRLKTRGMMMDVLELNAAYAQLPDRSAVCSVQPLRVVILLNGLNDDQDYPEWYRCCSVRNKSCCQLLRLFVRYRASLQANGSRRWSEAGGIHWIRAVVVCQDVIVFGRLRQSANDLGQANPDFEA